MILQSNAETLYWASIDHFWQQIYQAMRQKFKSESSETKTKVQRRPTKLESFLIRSIQEQVQIYNTLTEQASTEFPAQKQFSQNQLLPAISRKDKLLLPTLASEESAFGRKQKKIPSIMQYRSQKLLEAIKTKEEEKQTQQGKDRFVFQVAKLSQQSLQKQEKRGRYSLPNIAQKQPKVAELVGMKVKQGSLQKHRLKPLADVTKPKKKEVYLRIVQPETLTGWNSREQEFERIS